MKTNNNIYPETSQAINEIFNRNVDLNQFLIVPLDYAKENHTVQFCLGTGQYLLKKSLPIHNTTKGIKYLQERINKICEHKNISKRNVIIVLEDPPSYVKNFISVLKNSYNCFRVNAHAASKYRKSSRISSDERDLDGIVQCLINRHSYEISFDEKYYKIIKDAVHSRRKHVNSSTKIKNKIHAIIDVLFPKYLNEKDTALTPFSSASLELMKDNFSSKKIAKMRPKTLLKKLEKYKVKNPKDIVAKLIDLAKTSIPPAFEDIEHIQKSLEMKVALLELTKKCIKAEEDIMARNLVCVPGIYILSIPGLGLILTATIVAEFGDPIKWLPVKNLISYGGIIPNTKQTGGIGKLPITGKLPNKCNKILKDALIQIGYHSGQYLHPIKKYSDQNGEHFLKQHFKSVESRGGASKLSTAKLFVKIMYKMVKNKRFYYPNKQQNYSDSFALNLDCDHLLFTEETIKYIKTKLLPYDLGKIPETENLLAIEAENCKKIRTMRDELSSDNENIISKKFNTFINEEGQNKEIIQDIKNL